jgi:hypothetical protein
MVLVTIRRKESAKNTVKSRHHDVQGQPFLDRVSHSRAHDAVRILERTARSSARGARWSGRYCRHASQCRSARFRYLVRPGGRSLKCGSVVKLVKESSVYRGGQWFYVIETSLPYVEAVTLYDGIFNYYLWMMIIFWWMEVHTKVSYVH